jgi:general secretion pathway protein N
MAAAVAGNLEASISPALLPGSRDENAMLKLPRTALLLLSGLGLATGWIVACHAATSSTLDILTNDFPAPSDKVEVGTLRPLAVPPPDATRPPVSGNPLWSIPLSALTATQERPVFSVSRRPPPRAVAGPRVEPVAAPAVPAPVVIEHPPLALIGAVVGDGDAIAVFLDRSTQAVVRLRAGEAHGGWLLSSVLRREVTFTKDDRTEVLVLQRANSPASAIVPVVPPPAQVIGGTDGSYAPYIPRSTPKNGESDGL